MSLRLLGIIVNVCITLVAVTKADDSNLHEGQGGQTDRIIHIDAASVRGPLNTAFKFSVGSDRAIIHLRAEHQRDLRFVKQTCGFEYMRFHGLLNQEMEVVKLSSQNRITYDWTNVDRVYDFLVRDLKIRPIVELGFMPEPLASGKQTIFAWNGNVTPPKSYDQWKDLIEQLTRHLSSRYGRDEVCKWYFEVWNEPNLSGFWPAGQAEYFKLYECTTRAIKDVDPEFRVGGPSTAGFGWIKETLDFCTKNNVPIDFVSSHGYGAMEGFLDESGKGHTTLATSPDSVIDGLPSVLSAVRSSKWPQLPVLITEWGPSYSPRDPVHDSYFCAAWILQRLRRLPAGVQCMSYWTFSDQFEEIGLPSTPFHGGFGLLTMQGLPKPAYFAYRFLNQLGDTELACEDANVWACRDKRGGVQVLLWDYTQPKQDRPNSEFFARDWTAKEAPAVELELDNLAPGTHEVEITRVGYRHNDVYTAYLDLGAPKGAANKPFLIPDTVLSKLRAACSGTPQSQRISVQKAKPAMLKLPLNQNDVYFVDIEP